MFDSIYGIAHISWDTWFQYGPCTVTDLKEGETRLWCRCGLSKTQPWCDGRWRCQLAARVTVNVTKDFVI